MGFGSVPRWQKVYESVWRGVQCTVQSELRLQIQQLSKNYKGSYQRAFTFIFSLNYCDNVIYFLWIIDQSGQKLLLMCIKNNNPKDST